jgi:hypothetical protein
MKINLAFDIDTLRITDPGEDAQGENEFRPKSSSIIDSLKRQNAVVPSATTVDSDTGEIIKDPTVGLAIPKVRAQTDSTKLRQFLNNLGDESI